MKEPRKTCRATKADGSPCRQRFTVSAETGFCQMHDPAKREVWRSRRQTAARVTNLRRRVEPPPAPKTLEEAAKFASWIAWAASSRRLSAPAARAAQAALREFRALRESLDLADEVAALRSELAKLKQERTR